MKLVKQNKMFGGWVKQFKHASSSTKTEMTFSVFLPKQYEMGKVPALYYLSGLTCTDENFTTKAGAQRAAAKHGIALIAPDTSPRGANVPGEDDSYDFGTGAGFYVDATTPSYSTNYNMFSYITKELPSLLSTELPNIDQNNKSIFGHSMGGHGALICALKTVNAYKSVSAFSPISNPVNCPWGQKAFAGYLGENKKSWEEYDATVLVSKFKTSKKLNILVDQGSADEFYIKKQLLPENLKQACDKNKDHISLNMRFQEEYDHSYYFIATFVDDHIDFHANFLKH